jgi:TetR/AcrR family transcriptional repressor of mexCD-oprJ operon
VGQRPPDHRRAIAEHNIESILDAVEQLLVRGSTTSIAAVAVEARTSRVTVYAHFPTRERLLEAALDRIVRRATATLDAVAVDDGSPFEALDRLVGACWQLLERFSAMAAATAESLPSDRRRELHDPVMAPVLRLVERGRREGAFRLDVPADWLVACSYALMHAAADEVRAGRLHGVSAPRALSLSLHDLFAGDTTTHGHEG